MRIVYNKQLNSSEEQTVRTIAHECGILYDTARLLFYRNIDTVEKAKLFLSPSKTHFHNPFLLNGMNDAVNRLYLAKQRGENVLIFGDYDADGVCATTVLHLALKDFGIDARYTLPEREDGYGLNISIIEKLRAEKNIDLIVTVDCGISDYEKIEQLKSTGIEVIVTDHHQPPEIIPNCICINPKIVGQVYPFSELCGAGVAYKLAYALIGDRADKYLDFVATATVADSMDLLGENRDIVAEGLKLFAEPYIRPCFKQLLGDNSKQISATTLAFGIAPRINAGGRMGDAKCSLKLFTTDDENEIYDLVVKLNEYNVARQQGCDDIYREAKEKILKYKCAYDPVITVYDEKWKTGFVGIVSARLVEEYGRPVIIFAGHDGVLKGSARSIDGINIHEAITAVSKLLVGFGGHSQAAGVTVEKSKFSAFRNQLNAFVAKNNVNREYAPTINAEWMVKDEISLEFAREIELLEPFGVGNKKPLFTIEDKEFYPTALKNGSPHYNFKTSAIDMLWFNVGEGAKKLLTPVNKTVVFEVNRSIFRNKESVKGYVKCVEYDYSNLNDLSLDIFENEIKKFKDEHVHPIKIESVNANQINSSGYGSLFVVSDPVNLDRYPQLVHLPRYLFDSGSKALNDCIIVSPTVIPEGFEKLYYLDKPVEVIGGAEKVFVSQEYLGYKWIDNLSVDRSDFAQIFNIIRTLVGKEFGSSARLYKKYQPDCDAYQFVFALEVFMELGIFYVDMGVLKQNSKIKNALTNSKVYSKICSIR